MIWPSGSNLVPQWAVPTGSPIPAAPSQDLLQQAANGTGTFWLTLTHNSPPPPPLPGTRCRRQCHPAWAVPEHKATLPQPSRSCQQQLLLLLQSRAQTASGSTAMPLEVLDGTMRAAAAAAASLAVLASPRATQLPQSLGDVTCPAAAAAVDWAASAPGNRCPLLADAEQRAVTRLHRGRRRGLAAAATASGTPSCAAAAGEAASAPLRAPGGCVRH